MQPIELAATADKRSAVTFLQSVGRHDADAVRHQLLLPVHVDRQMGMNVEHQLLHGAGLNPVDGLTTCLPRRRRQQCRVGIDLRRSSIGGLWVTANDHEHHQRRCDDDHYPTDHPGDLRARPGAERANSACARSG